MESVYGLLVLILLGGFIGMWVWAWSSKRKKDFNEAAMLPFADAAPLNRQKENHGSHQQ